MNDEVDPVGEASVWMIFGRSVVSTRLAGADEGKEWGLGSKEKDGLVKLLEGVGMAKRSSEEIWPGPEARLLRSVRAE